MFSLLISVVALLLVAALALATLYYGGPVWGDSSARARAATIANQASQIRGAMELYYVHNGEFPEDIEALITAEYLKSKPMPPQPVADASLVSQVLAQSVKEWEVLAPKRPAFMVHEAVKEDVCRELNYHYRGSDAIFQKIDGKSYAQCYGPVEGAFTFVVGIPRETDPTPLEQAVEEYNRDNDPDLPIVTPEDPSNPIAAPEQRRRDPGTPEAPEDLSLTLAGESLPEATRNEYYSFDFADLLTMTGENQPPFSHLTWSLGYGSAAPAGLTLASDGRLAGTPTETGPADFTVVATYRNKSGRQAYRIVVNGQPLDVVQISSGAYHTCAVTVAGEAKCWGLNDNGQLGNGITGNVRTNRNPTPTTVPGLESGVTQISAGHWHTCAVVNGGVRCWGYNDHGQLGNSVGGTRWSPVSVWSLASGVAAISTTDKHTCALMTSGAVKCMGLNDRGQMGNGPGDTQQPVATTVAGLESGVVQVETGGYHTCALTQAGAVLCWGSSGAGQVGHGLMPVNQWTPILVSGLNGGVTAIAAGSSHSCALVGGAVKCWGSNSSGQVGNGNKTNQASPVDVLGLNGATLVSLAGGSTHTCGVSATGAAKCWGSNTQGELGDGTQTQSLVAVGVTGLANVTSISTGMWHTCAVVRDGGAKCWGANNYGYLGDRTEIGRTTPVDVKL
jgi:alpha-tubulin suppressor-like RCC1 family protein